MFSEFFVHISYFPVFFLISPFSLTNMDLIYPLILLNKQYTACKISIKGLTSASMYGMQPWTDKMSSVSVSVSCSLSLCVCVHNSTFQMDKMNFMEIHIELSQQVSCLQSFPSWNLYSRVNNLGKLLQVAPLFSCQHKKPFIKIYSLNVLCVNALILKTMTNP